MIKTQSAFTVAEYRKRMEERESMKEKAHEEKSIILIVLREKMKAKYIKLFALLPLPKDKWMD